MDSSINLQTFQRHLLSPSSGYVYNRPQRNRILKYHIFRSHRREKQSNRKKFSPVPLCPPQIPHMLARYLTQNLRDGRRKCYSVNKLVPKLPFFIIFQEKCNIIKVMVLSTL